MVQELIEAMLLLVKLAAKGKFRAAMRAGVCVLAPANHRDYVGGGG